MLCRARSVQKLHQPFRMPWIIAMSDGGTVDHGGVDHLALAPRYARSTSAQVIPKARSIPPPSEVAHEIEGRNRLLARSARCDARAPARAM